ncbi:Hypothetical protein R9X50_00098600 [Acrodontium crateriforme]|uniref:Enoyl reductase (ER) domain-containing protein n=1 Tax=Acrodontium crateriforme TaxID=150365 RepID=A0AAQ3R7P7_9PEZI|nr:Hypothetical protein R9X50_00098600 [Acrodontium crateriforme]
MVLTARPASRLFSAFRTRITKSHTTVPKMAADTVPTTQRAAVVHKTGGPSAIEYTVAYDAPKLDDVQPNSVLIKNVFAGVNFIDTNVRKGAMPAKLPIIPGMEGAGVVVAAGSEAATLFPAGSRVGYMGIGVQSYAQFTLVNAAQCVPVSDNVPFEDICAAMMGGMTAHYLVSADGSYEVKPGDHVLIHAGAGGLGLALTQICKAKGANVTTTVSSEVKAQKSKAAGATTVLRYANDDGSSTDAWVEQARQVTAKKGGFNVVYDSVGKSTFTHSLDLVAKCGTVVLFGAASGAPDAIAPLSLGPKSIKLTRPMLFHYVADPETLRRRANEVLSWIANGSVKFDYVKSPLADAAKVHEQLEGRQTTGKLLLEI